MIEGRRPNLFLSSSVIEPTEDDTLKAEYIRNKGFDDDHFKKMILDYLKKWKQASRKQIEALLWDKLSDVLDDKSKYHKITNILRTLKINEKIELTKGKKWIMRI